MKHSQDPKQTVTQDGVPPLADSPPSAPVNSSRRRFGKAGLAAPVMMTLASRPVWGTTAGGCSLSGDILSGNVSNNQARNDCTTGYGCTPGFWKNNTAAWGPTTYSPGQCDNYDDEGMCEMWDAFGAVTQFAAEFGSPPGCAPDYATLMEVLQTCSGHVAWHATAALLNAAHPYIDFGATVTQVREAWNKMLSGEVDAVQLQQVFDNMNNRGCPLNAHGDCDDKFTTVGDDPTCVPVKTSGDS